MSNVECRIRGNDDATVTSRMASWPVGRYWRCARYCVSACILVYHVYWGTCRYDKDGWHATKQITPVVLAAGEMWNFGSVARKVCDMIYEFAK